MASKNMKGHSIVLVIEVKTTGRYHFTPIWMAIIKNSNKYQKGCREIGILYTVK